MPLVVSSVVQAWEKHLKAENVKTMPKSTFFVFLFDFVDFWSDSASRFVCANIRFVICLAVMDRSSSTRLVRVLCRCNSQRVQDYTRLLDELFRTLVANDTNTNVRFNLVDFCSFLYWCTTHTTTLETKCSMLLLFPVLLLLAHVTVVLERAPLFYTPPAILLSPAAED